ncbi:hypothetical protein R3P38DRAFT_3355946 [Favolaschia claudopus]|uniref:Uncharacterized protein n=1 Tax=Favolaschia claudopus TaxID=2862362 RepID=A0AAW0BIG7_9AGAR
MKLETRNPSSRWQRSSRISGNCVAAREKPNANDADAEGANGRLNGRQRDTKSGSEEIEGGVNEETEEMLASTWWRRRRANGAGDDTALGLDVLKTEVIQYSNEPRAKRWREREGRWTMGTPNPPSFRFYRFQQFPNPNDTTKHVDGGAGAQIVAGNAIVLPIMARGGEDKEMSTSTSGSTEASRERWRGYQRTSQATKESSYGASTSLQEGGHPVGDILVFSLHVDGRRRRLGWKRGEVVVDDKGGGGNGSSDCHVADGVRLVGDKAAFGLTNPRQNVGVDNTSPPLLLPCWAPRCPKPLVGIVTDMDPDVSSSITLWQELIGLWRHVNELSAAMLEQSRHISQIVQVLTQPPPSLFPVHSEEDSGLCSTTPAAPSPPEPDAITPDVAPPRSSQPPSNSGAPPSPANFAPTLPGYSSAPLATPTSPSVPLRQTPRRTRDSDAALPELRGIFNRKKAPS